MQQQNSLHYQYNLVVIILIFIYINIIMVKHKGGNSGITPTPSNLFNFFSFMTPFLLVFFLVMISIFNMDIQGFIYLGGILMASIINIFFMNIIKNPANPDRNPLCGVLNFPFFGTTERYDSPSLNSLILCFTFAYLILPMIFNRQTNYIVIITLISLFIIDSFSQVTNKCTNASGTILGSLVGFVLGAIYYTIIYHSGNKNLLYFEEFQSNNVICKRPRKQQFKCRVFKNGELVSSTVA